MRRRGIRFGAPGPGRAPANRADRRASRLPPGHLAPAAAQVIHRPPPDRVAAGPAILPLRLHRVADQRAEDAAPERAAVPPPARRAWPAAAGGCGCCSRRRSGPAGSARVTPLCQSLARRREARCASRRGRRARTTRFLPSSRRSGRRAGRPARSPAAAPGSRTPRSSPPRRGAGNCPVSSSFWPVCQACQWLVHQPAGRLDHRRLVVVVDHRPDESRPPDRRRRRASVR